MGKQKRLDSFFQKKNADITDSSTSSKSPRLEHQSCNQSPSKSPIVNVKEVDYYLIERDPGLRQPIWDYAVNKRDEIRRAYLRAGPFQIHLSSYPYSLEKHPRRFQFSWFTQFSSWLEYSPTKDAAYCLPCYLFNIKPNGRPGWDVFIIKGFRSWRKVNAGKNCAFLKHIGDDPCSPHNNAMRSCVDLMKQSGHIDKVMNQQNSEQILKNNLRVKTSIDAVRWLAFQACAFRGHDKTSGLKNRGNFLELIQLLASYNDDVKNVVLENAPKSVKYISSSIQKEILHVLATKVRKKIREDIGDSKFCIIVDEARDESKREQMAIVLRFVDINGFIRERFFDLAHVKDTCSLTLKNEICDILSRHTLDVQNIRGQGYDGASNMHGEWNRLQALFLKECPFAYYVHCFAHRLQLALVAASREVHSVYEFFNSLSFIINSIDASCKSHEEIQVAQEAKIAHMLANNELKTGKGANQIGSLKRAGDTRWGSHFNSICSLISMFDSTCYVLENIRKDESIYSQRGDASAVSKLIQSLEFIFILHLMKEIMGIIDILRQALQQKSQDILNAMHLVSSTKKLIQDLRENDWNSFLKDVLAFCENHDLIVPDLTSQYLEGRRRKCLQSQITMEHHYHFEIFNEVIDFQLQELNARFSMQTLDLLKLSTALDPNEDYKYFNVDDISTLAEKYYPFDFTEQDRLNLRFQLKHFEYDMHNDVKLQNLSCHNYVLF